MTLKELQRVLAEVQGQGSPNPQLDSLLERLAGKEFWCGHTSANVKDCCFNHIIGLPEKQAVPRPIFDYEMQLLNELLLSTGSIKDKHLFIKKATGLGITEFCLRFMVWLRCNDDT